MSEVAVQFSFADASAKSIPKRSSAKQRKSSTNAPTSSNLFNHQQRRSQSTQSSVGLPIISLPSFDDFAEKFTQSPSNSKIFKQPRGSSPINMDYRLRMPKTEVPILKTRTTLPSVTKSPIVLPTTNLRPQTSNRPGQSNNYQKRSVHGDTFLYIVNAQLSPRRNSSARIQTLLSPNPPNIQQPQQQQQTNLSGSMSLSRPNSQYSHFLSYLRRQSLARLRRRQEQEDGNHDGVETTVIINSTKQPLLAFQSTSNITFNTLGSESSTIPALSIGQKRTGRPVSSFFRPAVRTMSTTMSSSTNRLSVNPSVSLRQVAASSNRKIYEDSMEPSPASSVLLTPNNSIVDENSNGTLKKATYDVQLAGDVLNYSYISDTGVKYQGQLLSSLV